MIVVLVTSIPFMSAGTDIQGAQRVVSSTKLRALTMRGVLILDSQTIVSGYVPNAAKLASTPSAFLASDGSHLDDQAHGLLGSALAALISPLLA